MPKPNYAASSPIRYRRDRLPLLGGLLRFPICRRALIAGRLFSRYGAITPSFYRHGISIPHYKAITCTTHCLAHR